MKDLRTLSVRQLTVAWLSGMALASVLTVASLVLQRQVVGSMARPMVRRTMLAAGRARELDSLYTQYARAHPDDRSAQSQAAQRHAERVQAERRDSLNRLLIDKAHIDTTFDGRAESERAWTMRLSGMFAALALRTVGLLTPLALMVLTVVWGVHRGRSRQSSERS